MGYEELKIEGRNAVLEAFRSGKTIDKLFVLDGYQDGPVRTIVREAKKHDTIIHFVEKERLDQLSETKKHQGVIAVAAAYEYAEVDDILEIAREKGEPPFLFLLDNIEAAQSRGDHPYRESLRSTRGHYSKAQGGGTDRDCGKDVRRRAELYAGCQGDESHGDDQGVKGAGHLVCLRGYGRHADV